MVREVLLDLADDVGVVCAVLVKPEDGRGVACARVTASFTQSSIGASFVWLMRNTEPSSTGCVKITFPSVSVTSTLPAEGSSKVLSWLPYSSAFCAMRPTFGTVPMVFGSNAPFALQNSTTSLNTPA